MASIGERLREERERLRFSQAAFGELGGVKANAQGNYEKGDRYPDAAYLAAVAEKGVDVLYVVTGRRTPLSAESSDQDEAQILKCYRALPVADKGLLSRTATVLAEAAARDNVSKRNAQ